MKNEKGITFIALIIIVVVLLIIASVTIYNGTDSLNSTLLNGFYTQLEIVQERIDDVSVTNESYIDENGNEIYIKLAGADLTEAQKVSLKNILTAQEITDIDSLINNFRYFTTKDIENILDLKEINYNLFINFENRIVVAENGITIDETTYYMLENVKYFVEKNETKNNGNIESLEYGTPIEYGNNTCKVSVNPKNTIGDLDNTGYIKYKKTTSKYWKTTIDSEIIVEFEKEYDIIYSDLNNNSIQRKIKIEYKKDEQGNLEKDAEGNNILIVKE